MNSSQDVARITHWTLIKDWLKWFPHAGEVEASMKETLRCSGKRREESHPEYTECVHVLKSNIQYLWEQNR